jgi:hypothetical protein
MPRVVALLLVLVTDCSPGLPASTDEAITNGRSDPADSCVVGLIEDGALACSGTLIAPRAVLSAAHCVQLNGRTSNASVFFGSMFTADSPVVPVERTLIHPGFDRITLENDAAVLILAADAPAGATVCAPVAGAAPPPAGATVRVAGFGRSAALAGLSGARLTGYARVTSSDATSITLAAADSLPCAGDSGGPAFSSTPLGDVIVGITSSGDELCSSAARDVRVDAIYDDFIRPAVECASGETCRYGAEKLGAACTSDDDCESQLCVFTSSFGGTCGETCFPATLSCPQDLTCLPYHHAAGEFACAPHRDNVVRGGCELGAGRPAPVVSMFLVACLLLRTRLRRDTRVRRGVR